ncbi:aromatic-ring hydroxylase C-terminal domain-containing protein [Streptomyces broussonetiae]|uniref:aromatic-ring hydroxylase C-terminal domain-containing protein n=1 Tax=Streptomyces broussonetiae TaxID=2686304 RepID=UPI00389AE510
MARVLEISGAQREFDAPEIHFGLRYRSAAIIEDPRVPVRHGKPGPDWRPGSEPGCRAAHAWWDAGTSTLDLFGHGFVLLCFGHDGEPAGLERAFAARGVPLTVRCGAGPQIARLYERSFVLVRPDGHVAWRGDELPRHSGVLADTVRGERAGTVPTGADG